jgi:hypothetical protein
MKKSHDTYNIYTSHEYNINNRFIRFKKISYLLLGQSERAIKL